MGTGWTVDSLIGATLGLYRIEGVAGRGGTAAVYRARQPALGRTVAIKVLSPLLAADPSFLARFQREAAVIAGLMHPNILPVYDFGEQDGRFYIVMGFAPGGTLRDRLRSPPGPERVVRIVGQVADALDYAHRRGVVHRDVKPSNVLLGDGDWALLGDFGIARMVAGDDHPTPTGTRVGTPAYMSPEQGLGRRADARSDVYSLGVVLYELLTGRLPFDAPDPLSTLNQHVHAPLPLPSRVSTSVPPAMDRVVARAMAKEPDDRYRRAGELKDALEAALRVGRGGTGAANWRSVQSSRLSDAATVPVAVSNQVSLAGRSVGSVPPSGTGPVVGWSPLSLDTSPPATTGEPATSPPAGTPPMPASGSGAPPGRERGVPERPIFQRTIRLPPELPEGEVEIPPPPPVPIRPSFSLLTTLLPGLFAVAFLVASVLTVASGNLSLTIFSVGFMGITSVTSLFGYRSQRSAYDRAVREREGKYRAHLDAVGRQLADWRRQQQRALEQSDPAPRECADRAERRDRRLWERTPAHADFLTPRLGLGEQPFAVVVRAPRQQNVIEPDPLIQAAQQLADQSARVDEVPIDLPLREAGVAGLAGPRAGVLNAARALAMQIATHHSPDEVKIVALFPATEANTWSWLRWLPHVWSDDHSRRYLAYERSAAHTLLADLEPLLLSRRRSQPSAGKDAASTTALPFFVFFLADLRLAEGEPLLHLLLTEGRSLGACSILLADRRDALPQGCQAIVELASGQAQLIRAGPSPGTVAIVPDEAPLDRADRLARSLAPLRLQQLAPRPTEIPATVPLLDLLGVRRVEDMDVVSRWQSSEPWRSLAAPIGLRAGAEVVALDLHEPPSGSDDSVRFHGPNGLVAGTVGSGKTELLQVLLASLAVHFHPHDVVFVLFDFKGGSMLSPFQELPHVVNAITDLEIGLVPRALVSLEAEIERRERIFDAARKILDVTINHLDDYLHLHRQGQVAERLPYLVLVVDEFTVLKNRLPEAMERFVTVAIKGRSLGFRMILATQKPAGVVDEQIDANTRFRLCLRVARPEDSQEMIKTPLAADLIGAGRAYFQVGNHEPELFQAAWSGAPYLPDALANGDPEAIAVVALDGRHRPLNARPGAPPPAGRQLPALVGYLRETAAANGIRRLRGAWLPPLPTLLPLDAVRRQVWPAEGWDGQGWGPAQHWLAPVIGLVDDPRRQRQDPLRVDLGKEGHLAVYGAPQTSGKTTLVQTLVTSLALTYSPRDVHLYLLDFGGKLLTLFTPLPHVGAVILKEDAERVSRLLRFLLQEIDVRRDRFAGVGVNTLAAYREATGDPMAAIVVVLDNYPAFAGSYPEAEDLLVQIAREGGNFGIHLVLTAPNPGAVKPRLRDSVPLALALPLADRGQYGDAIGWIGGLDPAPLPGRGLIRGKPPLEFQTALPAGGNTEAERTADLKVLIQRLVDAWPGPRATPIRVLPDVVALSELLPAGDASAPPPADGSLAVSVGLDVETLDPLTVDLADGTHFLIAGPFRSGKTTFLQTWLLALAERFPPTRLHLYLVDFRSAGLGPLARLPHVKGYLADDDQLGDALAEIAQTIRERRQAPDARPGHDLAGHATESDTSAIVVAVEDYAALRDGTQAGTRERLEQLIRRERGGGFHVILAGAAGDLTSSWEGLVKALKEFQSGFLLGSSDPTDAQVLNLRLPLGEAGRPLPPGQGYAVCRGHYRKLKAATAAKGDPTLLPWIDRIVRRWEQAGLRESSREADDGRDSGSP